MQAASITAALGCALAVLTACESRILYTVEGAVTSSQDGAAIPGIRVTCAIADEPQSEGEAVTDETGGYSCSALIDGVAAGRGPRTIEVSFIDEDDAQNGTFQDASDQVVVQPDGVEVLDVELDPTG